VSYSLSVCILVCFAVVFCLFVFCVCVCVRVCDLSTLFDSIIYIVLPSMDFERVDGLV
jgi:hypothetical protein